MSTVVTLICVGCVADMYDAWERVRITVFDGLIRAYNHNSTFAFGQPIPLRCLTEHGGRMMVGLISAFE